MCDGVRHVFTDLGCLVDDGEPDVADADEIFQVLRAWSFAQERGEDLRLHRDLMKDTVIWNIEQGLTLTGLDVSRAEARRSALRERVRAFLERYEFLVLPVSQVAPFPVDVEWVREINGVKMNTYIDWMATCYAITLTRLPAISVPCGFSTENMPIGLQLMGPQWGEEQVLSAAYAYEQSTEWHTKKPTL